MRTFAWLAALPLTLWLTTALLAQPAQSGSSSAKIIYSKSFPKSTPEFVLIELSRSGAAVYKESPQDEQPISFKLSPEETQAIFALAEKLEKFKKPLESGIKVAFMGEKTYRWEEGATKNETKFNYSIDEDARVLQDWFDKLTETQLLLFELEKTARFDRLGVNKALLQIEAAYDRKRLIGPDRFLPMLDRVAKNESYLHMARERAASLADAFRGLKAKAE
jgi:hypothetical protein